MHSMFMIHPTTLGPFQEAVAWERLDAATLEALAKALTSKYGARQALVPGSATRLESPSSMVEAGRTQ